MTFRPRLSLRTVSHIRCGFTAELSLVYNLNWLCCATWFGLVLVSSLVAVAQEPDLATMILSDGSRFSAALLELDENGNAVLRDRSGAVRKGAEELVSWGEFRDTDRQPLIVLSGGTVIAGEITAIGDEVVHLSSESFPAATVQRAHVLGMVWRPSADAFERDQQVLRVANANRSADQVWLANGDQLTGTILSGSDPVAALGTGLSEIAILPRVGTQPVKAAVENISAIGFAAEATALPPANAGQVLLALRDGSRLAVQKISADRDQLQVMLSNREVLVLDASALRERVTGVQWLGDHITYVSDLESLGHKHIPFLSLSWDLGIDRNVAQGLLRSGGRIYPKGIGMHSTSRVAYALDKQFRRFEADLAVDQAAGRNGSVTFRVFLERAVAGATTPQWQVSYESPILRGGEAPVPISVDVSDALRMALVVDFADRGDEWDHADWLHARLMR